jgi:hypothetical protein
MFPELDWNLSRRENVFAFAEDQGLSVLNPQVLGMLSCS